MRCMTAIWPAGPPKLRAAILAQTKTASRNEIPCAGTFVFASLSVSTCTFALQFVEEVAGVSPTDRLHECFDVASGLGAEVDMIGVLVHVEREYRRCARKRVAMVGSPLIDQLAIARRPRQQHPAGAAAERLAHGDKFGLPALAGAKVARQG